MISEDTCEGCGALLQSEHPEAPGYVPVHVARRGEPVVCRRCFRINHYGKEDQGLKTDQDGAWTTVMEAVDAADAVIMLLDILDFEGSFIPSLAQACQGRLLIAANKTDLLPSKTPVDEVVRWVKSRLAARGLSAQGVYSISGRTGYGVRVLLESARRAAGRGGKLAIVGATNVGKSTLVNRWLKSKQDEGPTVSRFPGTTIGVLTKEIDGMDLTLLDTPGLITRGRVSDLFCPTCAAKLVPDAPITSKLTRLTGGQTLVMGELAAFTPIQARSEEHLLLAFSASAVPIVKVKEDKLDRWFSPETSPSSSLLCDACQATLQKTGWEQVTTDVAEMEDVAIHGLGWVSPRRRGLQLRVTLPAGAFMTLRPRLVGPKTPVGGQRAPSR